MSEIWRVLKDPPLTGKENMQRDVELLNSVAGGSSPPVLRLYRWFPAAISLGYFQKVDSVVNRQACERLGIDIVRRPTGGRAVLHCKELTYSIVVPERHPLVPQGVLAAYKFFSEGILIAFTLLGIKAALAPRRPNGAIMRLPLSSPGSCFDTPSPYELKVNRKKVAGSAQLRRKGAILQHGSIYLQFPLELYRQVLLLPACNSQFQEYMDYLGQHAAGLQDLGYDITWDELADALVEGFSQKLRCQAQFSDLS